MLVVCMMVVIEKSVGSEKIDSFGIYCEGRHKIMSYSTRHRL